MSEYNAKDDGEGSYLAAIEAKRLRGDTHYRHIETLTRELDVANDRLDVLGVKTPSCPYCGTTEGLRQLHDGGGYIAPEYTCEGCFTPQDDGPCFDDLPAQERL